jgi:glycosyltransferase involved in cell wall biosynthesis
MIKILICEASLGYGGSGAYLYSFLKHLDKDNFHPIVSYNVKGDGPFIDKIEQLNIEVGFLSHKHKNDLIDFSSNRIIKYFQIFFNLLKNNFGPIIKLIAIIKKNKIDLILLNQDVVFHIPAIFAAAITRTPCVVRKGGIGIHPKNKLIWKILSRVPAVFVASSHAEYNFHVNSGFPYKKMVVIYEGVDVAAFHPVSNNKKIHNELGIPLDTYLIAVISRFDEGKGHEDVIAAAPEVLRNFPNAAFLIVGNGEESIKCKLIEQVRSLGLKDKVIFTGWRTDTADILNEIDVFVHCPNQWLEGMGIATLEALASGKPVVISDNWGLSDTTQDGFNGFVVPIGEKKMISEKILALLKDTELRTRMGFNSRNRALELFDIGKNIKAIERIIYKTLNSNWTI